MTQEYEYCNGMGCPIKEDCKRYRNEIDKKTQWWLALAPYSHIDKKCGFFMAKGKNNFVEQLKTLKNGRAESNPDGES